MLQWWEKTATTKTT